MAGKEGCPCIDTTSALSSLTEQYCTLSDGSTIGVQLTVGGSCVPFTYGALSCKQHDLIHDPKCTLDQLLSVSNGVNATNSSSNNNVIVPPYCFRSFCYVDPNTCKKQSDERVYRSGYFGYDTGVELFYSYSTCNSTADDWLEVEDDIVGHSALGGIGIDAAVPAYVLPYMYKRDSSGEIISPEETGDEYFDDSIPYEGLYINFAKSIMEISNGDIRSMNFTHRSRVSSILHPTSKFTAAVQDIEDGLVDIAVGPFWVTGQRLRMSSFSLPFTYDKTYLVIPNPGTADNLNFQIQKVLQPFSLGLWGLVLAVIVTAALLSVWFADNEKLNADRRKEGMARPSNRRRRKKRVSMAVYGRLAFDQCLQKGLFFCSAGVEQDNTSSLPDKLLLFGFGFFILIAVSAYVANLAAFLTLSSASDAVTSIDQAVALGIKICAHPAVKTELQLAHPDANFFFHEDGDEFVGMLNDYDAGKCKLLAIGYEDTSNNGSFLDRLCERELVYTESVIAEIPMAFPLRQGISSGFSYWMYQGERSGVTLETSKSEFPVVANCDVHLNTDVTEGSETDQITIKNMFLPIIFFVVCAFIAVILQIKHMRNVKQGRKSLVGRKSSFNLTQSVAVEDGIDDFDTKQLRNNLASLRRRPNPPVLDENFSFDNGGGEEEDKKGLPQSMSCRSLMKGEFPEQQEKNNADSFLENSIASDFPGVSRSKLDV